MAPEMSPVPDENDQRTFNAHLDEILAKSVAARRVADAQDGRSSDLGDIPHPTSRSRPRPPQTILRHLPGSQIANARKPRPS
ncbi:hypothetical protein [Microvirga sp. VF16]|uniref:hypothetical protein n=1 Tax=Microvirga sp. VF16 TaxID=2807101 RepID=UPI00193CDC18|nr:hypothetical protein [Microvirga sp. VF16]QRM34454.1 hypothetical protein JO965_35260 [Microvirga sp. VF16]